MTPTGLRKAAILLTLLGEDTAGEIFRHLPEPEVRQLAKEISDLTQVAPATALSVLEEYFRQSETPDSLAQGGVEYATRLLIRAFGEEEAREWLRQSESGASQFSSLQKADPQQLARFLEREHPQTVALVLAHLETKRASAMLLRLPEGLRADAVRRLAKLRQFSPEIAQKVSTVLERQLASFGEQNRQACAGLRSVADMLNRMEPATGKSILDAIEQDTPDLALDIRNLMFTFEDLLSVTEAGIRELLAQLDKKTLALALRGASEELQTYIFKSMSSRAVEMLKEDMEVLGAVRSKDVTHAQQEVVAVARKLESEGKLNLSPETDDEYVV